MVMNKTKNNIKMQQSVIIFCFILVAMVPITIRIRERWIRTCFISTPIIRGSIATLTRQTTMQKWEVPG